MVLASMTTNTGGFIYGNWNAEIHRPVTITHFAGQYIEIIVINYNIVVWRPFFD